MFRQSVSAKQELERFLCHVILASLLKTPTCRPESIRRVTVRQVWTITGGGGPLWDWQQLVIRVACDLRWKRHPETKLLRWLQVVLQLSLGH